MFYTSIKNMNQLAIPLDVKALVVTVRRKSGALRHKRETQHEMANRAKSAVTELIRRFIK